MTNKVSIVLVDDNTDVLAALKKGLELNNYEVMAFDKPLEALESIKSTHSPQLLISDIRMPKMNGFELARAVHKHNPNMKILLLTAFEIDKAEFEKVFPSTIIDGLVHKPIGIKKLVDTIKALLADKKVNSEV